jgi:CRP-like cAMP-binding protein
VQTKDLSVASLSMLERILHLKKVPAIGGLSGTELALIAEQARERQFSKNEPLLREGEVVDSIFVIVEGHVAVARRGVRLGRMGPGDSVGGLEFLARDARGVDARAQGSVFALELEADALVEVFEDSFAVVHHILREVCGRVIDGVIRQPHVTGLLRVPLAYTPQPPLDFVERIRFLRQIAVFSRSSINALSELSRAMNEVRFDAGTELWRAGEPAHSVFLVVDGRVDCFIPSSNSRFDGLPGDPLGALDAMAETLRWYDATTATPVVALYGNTEGLLDVFEDNTEMALDYLAVMSGLMLQLVEARAGLRGDGEAAANPAAAPAS